MTRIALDWMIEGTSIESPSSTRSPRVSTPESSLLGPLRFRLCATSLAAFGARPARHSRSVNLSWWLRCPLSTASLVGWNPAYPPLHRTRDCRSSPRDHFSRRSPPRPNPSRVMLREILDGNVLTGTEHRVTELRLDSFGGPAGGMSLAIYEPISGLVLDLILEESSCAKAGTQAAARSGAYRAWTTLDHGSQLLRSDLPVPDHEQADASFLVRWHSSTMPFKPIKPLRSVGVVDTGEIFEQPIRVNDPKCKGRRYRLRRIVLRLDRPTRDGETEIILITNLPKSVPAELCCGALPPGDGKLKGTSRADRPAPL